MVLSDSEIQSNGFFQLICVFIQFYKFCIWQTLQSDSRSHLDRSDYNLSMSQAVFQIIVHFQHRVDKLLVFDIYRTGDCTRRETVFTSMTRNYGEHRSDKCCISTLI